MEKSFRSFAIVFICGLIGIIQAYILYVMNLEGIVVDEYITGSITIENVMALTILVWAMIGVVASAFD